MITAGKANVLVDMYSAYEIAALLEEASMYMDDENHVKAEMYCTQLMESAAELQTPYESSINKSF